MVAVVSAQTGCNSYLEFISRHIMVCHYIFHSRLAFIGSP